MFANARAGLGKVLSVTAYTVNDGNGGNNYTVTMVNSASGAINKADLAITAATNTKTYDSTNGAAATPTVSGLERTDTVTGLVETYTSRRAPARARHCRFPQLHRQRRQRRHNYNVTTTNDTTGEIDQAALTITAATNTKTYDATTSAVAKPTVLGLLGNDKVTGLAEVYADKNAGFTKTLSVAYTINDGNLGKTIRSPR